MRTIRFKLDPQLRVIVDLSVKHNDETAIITCHWLRCAVGQIDDGEAAVPEPAAPVATPLQACAVRTAGAHRIPRRDELHLLGLRRGPMKRENTVYAAPG